jgi:hypothetical protein
VSQLSVPHPTSLGEPAAAAGEASGAVAAVSVRVVVKRRGRWRVGSVMDQKRKPAMAVNKPAQIAAATSVPPIIENGSSLNARA